MGYNIIVESAWVVSGPKNVKKRSDSVIFETVLQTLGDINKNRRMYDVKDMKAALTEGDLPDRIKMGGYLGELDHPIDDNPRRQLTVLQKECSHRFLEIGIDGNKIVGVVQTIPYANNGNILRGLAEIGVPVGFSFRGTGILKEVTEGTDKYNRVQGPITAITWDSVSDPSHSTARLLRITEGVVSGIKDEIAKDYVLTEGTELTGKKYKEENGYIFTEDGVCYLPNAFDYLVEKRVITLLGAFK
jgi:hypothetical protein